LLQAKRGRQRDFEAALQILRGKDADISEEAEEVQVHILLDITLCLCFNVENKAFLRYRVYMVVSVIGTQDYITTLEQLPKSGLLELFHRRYLRSLTVTIPLSF